MIRARRDGPHPGRFLYTRVGLFFLGAGVWLGGVLVEDRRITGAALGILILAAILGLLDRRMAPPEPPDGEGERERADGE